MTLNGHTSNLAMLPSLEPDKITSNSSDIISITNRQQDTTFARSSKASRIQIVHIVEPRSTLRGKAEI